MTGHPYWVLSDVQAATIPAQPFVAVLHCNCAEKALPVKDGLPKMKDYLSGLGGGGKNVPE